MNWPFHSMVSGMLNRTVSSWDRASACGYPEALRELACRAPHAPSQLQSYFVFRELRAKIRRSSSDCDVLKHLQLGASDGKNSAVKATSKLSHRPDKRASEHVHKNQVPGRRWSDRIAEANCAARFQQMLGTVKRLIQTILKHEICARLRFQLPPNNQQSHRPPVPKARQIQGTIDTHRLTEAPQLPLVGNKGSRSLLKCSLEKPPAQH
jgi:hypothetical protein